MDDPGRLRISDDDRNRVAEVLRHAAGEGRIDLEELDERLEAAYRAKTYGELVPITADLPVTPVRHPVPAPQAVRPAQSGPMYSSSVAVMSESKREGTWIVPDEHTAFALMGSVLLDLREAAFTSHEVVINASAVMGEVKVVVDAGTSVIVDGFGVMGEFKEARAKVPFDGGQGGPVVRVRGMALMGSVHVQRKAPPGRSGGRRRGLPPGSGR
jgi:Domain of unknown function (DUF1707)